MTKRRTIIILTLITLGGFLLRLIFLLNRGPFWFDEAWSVHFSSIPSWAETWKYWIIETNPFLHTLILRGIIHLFGEGATTVRLLSLLVGTACIPLTYVIARQCEFEKSTAFVATALIALSQNHIYFSAETRIYALLCLLTTLGFLSLLRIISGRAVSNTLIALYGLIILLSLYSHLTILALIPIHFLIIFLAYHQNIITKNSLKKLLFTLFLSGALFLIWFIPSILQKINSGLINGWYFSTASKYDGNILMSVTSLFTNTSTPATGLMVFGIICAGAFFFFIIKLFTFEKPPLKHWTILAWAIFPIIIAACFGHYIPKFFNFCLPAIAIILAAFGKRITDAKLRFGFYAILLIVPFTTSLPALMSPTLDPRNIVNYIEKRATDKSVIMINPFNEILTWGRYYHGPGEIVGAYPTDDQLSMDERIARYNWQKITISDEDLQKWYCKQAETKQIDKIFFIEPCENPSHAVTVLLQMGWRYTGRNNDEFTKNHSINYYVHEILPPIANGTSTPSGTKNKSR